MIKRIVFLVLLGNLIISCNENKSTETINEVTEVTPTVDTASLQKDEAKLSDSDAKIIKKLPQWVLKSKAINGVTINKDYKIENRLNTLYLEEDFNGDGNPDIALPIAEIKTNKKGFAVIHGKTLEVFILGAGKTFENALGDDQDYIDSWTINRKKENEPGVEEETGNGADGVLILENPSIEIDASEVGGGQIYWNGTEYAYFHQTC